MVASADITEERRAEQAIIENNATIRALLETASQAILGVDQGGIIRIVNQMAEQAFGYTRDELLGHSLENLLPSQLRSQHTKYRAEYTAAPRQRRMGEHQSLVAQRKDGTSFPVEISLSYVETREGVLSVAFVTDTTEREQAAQALRDSEARFPPACRLDAADGLDGSTGRVRRLLQRTLVRVHWGRPVGQGRRKLVSGHPSG